MRFISQWPMNHLKGENAICSNQDKLQSNCICNSDVLAKQVVSAVVLNEAALILGCKMKAPSLLRKFPL